MHIYFLSEVLLLNKHWMKLFFRMSADVHALNKWRETPLLTAANHGQAYPLLTAATLTHRSHVCDQPASQADRLRPEMHVR